MRLVKIESNLNDLQQLIRKADNQISQLISTLDEIKSFKVEAKAIEPETISADQESL